MKSAFFSLEQEGGFSNFLEGDIELLMKLFSAIRWRG
jgi:hypothetical protein